MKHAKQVKHVERRQKAFDDLKGEGTGTRPNSKYVRTALGKFVMYHRPGSNKK